MSKKCVCTPKGLLDEILQSKLDEKDASPELLDIAKGETERQFHGEVPERPDGLTLNEHFDQLNKKMPKGRGLEKQAFRDGLLVSTKRNSNAETTARVEAEYGKKGIQGLGDKALINRTNKRLAELTNTVETPENSFTADNTERTQVLMRELDRRIAKAQADLVDASKLQEARTAIGLAFSEYSNKGGKAVQQITGRDDVQKALDAVMEEAFTPQNKKLKAEIDKAVDSISESEITELLPSVAINKGTRDIGTQLQDLKTSQGTQVYTPDDIRRGVDVIGSHDSFLAQDTLEALGYPLKFSKNRKDPNSSGWSTVIGGKKIELYPGDSLGGLLRRNKISLNTLEKGLINKKYGDVVKRLVDDLDPNDLTLNETEARQKLTDYYDNLPKDGGLLTSREAEAFSLLDNAKTPEELNAVERYVSENENDYQDGFHEEFYSQWNEKHKALEDGYKAGIENRVAKADETRQLKATEELKVLRKQLDESNKKLEALHNELANIDPIAMLERKSIERIKQDPKGVLGGLIRELAEGRITESQFDNHLRRFPADIVNMMAKTVGCA